MPGIPPQSSAVVAVPARPADTDPVPLLGETPSGFQVAAADLEARLDRSTGTLASLKHRGREVRFRFRLRPFDGGKEAALELARTNVN